VRVSIVVASSDSAVLTIGGARHAVSRKARTITIQIRPERKNLQLGTCSDRAAASRAWRISPRVSVRRYSLPHDVRDRWPHQRLGVLPRFSPSAPTWAGWP